MTQTPDLARRIAVIGVAVVLALLVAVEAVLWFSLRASLYDALDDTLDARVTLVQAEALGRSPERLAERLQELGLRAVVRTPTESFAAEPGSPRLGQAPPPDAFASGPSLTRRVDVGNGTEVTVFARTSGVTRTLRQLLLTELAVTALAVALAGLLLQRVARIALRPLSDIAAAAGRTAAGRRGERLEPDRPDTELGRMATSYDTMVAALETAADDARKAQRESALLAAIVENSDAAVVSIDLDGCILSWNSAAERIYGWPASSAIGQSVWLIIPPDAREEYEALLVTAREGTPVRRAEGERLMRSGVRVPVGFTLSPVRDPDGQVVAVSELTRDLTEHRWMAQTLDSTLSALALAADEARASEERTATFLADAAHQLRTPLAGIQASAELLLRGAAAENRDKLLANMVRETGRAARLITGLLRMARLDQGKALAPEPTDVRVLCADEVDRARLLAPQLEVRLTAATDAPALATAQAVREIVANLIDNARRHAAAAIDVTIRRHDGAVEVRVADDGPGLADDERERVFERFVSLDGRGGSGLGLPIARGLARAMGGDLVYDGAFVLRLQPAAGTVLA